MVRMVYMQLWVPEHIWSPRNIERVQKDKLSGFMLAVSSSPFIKFLCILYHQNHRSEVFEQIEDFAQIFFESGVKRTSS